MYNDFANIKGPGTCNAGLRKLGDKFCDDDANNEACEYDRGDCCLSDENSFRYCLECECKEPGKRNVVRSEIQKNTINPPSLEEEPPTGFKDCGKRLVDRDAGLGFSNGPSVSTLQVIFNHIQLCMRYHTCSIDYKPLLINEHTQRQNF